MARLESLAKWRAIASLDPPYGFFIVNNSSALLGDAGRRVRMFALFGMSIG